MTSILRPLVRRPLALVVRAVVLVLWTSAAPAQTTLTLPLAEARALATQALLAGDPGLAVDIAADLVAADPADRAALLVLAGALPMLDRARDGRLAGARAYALSATDAEKYEAARLTALAAANEGRFTLAQWWLRRALTVAPTEQDAAQTITDAQGLRRINPWSSSVELSFAPSDNVNGGAATRFNVIDGVPVVGLLSPDAQALSGWTGTLDLRSRYRLAAGADFQTTVSARAYGRGVLLSDQAQAFLTAGGSDATANDFSTALLEFGLRHDRALSRGTYGLDLTLGQSWSGGDFDHTFLRLGADRRVPLSEASSLSFAGTLEQRWDQDDDPNEWRFGWQAGWTLATDSGQLGVTLSQTDVRSERVNDTGVTRTAQVSYAFARPWGPAQVQVAAGVQWQDFDDYRVGFIAVPGGRQDQRLFGSVDLFFADTSYAGFAPVVTLSAGQTDSNVSRFARSDLSVGFAFRSTF